MDLSSQKIREYTRRILLSRMRLLSEQGFYGVLLMHMKIGLGEEHAGAWYTDEQIFLNPAFLEQISDNELDYVLEHEILHVVLRHKTRMRGFDPRRFDKACDIVVNSIILETHFEDTRAITLRCHQGIQPHTSGDGREGREHTVEEVYELMPLPSQEASQESGQPGSSYQGWDYHFSEEESAGQAEDAEYQDDAWAQRLQNACKSLAIRDATESCGALPSFAARLYRELRKPQIDWRTVLQDFLQEEVCDYSFMPPDRRLMDSPFFLPDFNDTELVAKDILFMIDTSGSISDKQIAAAYSQIVGALDQFNGKLEGWVGFFDAAVTPPVPFVDQAKLLAIKPRGGGGTSFCAVFAYVEENMLDQPPASIVVLTDGWAPWPEQAMAHDIPVLWIINNEDAEPPWGRVARICV